MRAGSFRKGPLDGNLGGLAGGGGRYVAGNRSAHCYNGLDSCDPDQPYFRDRAGTAPASLCASLPRGTHGPALSAAPARPPRSGSVRRGSGPTRRLRRIRLRHHRRRRQSPAADKNGVRLASSATTCPISDRVPSDLGDFCLYGGLYRHVSLVYLPALALDAVHILPTSPTMAPRTSRSKRGSTTRPAKTTSPCTLSIEVTDAAGRSIHSATHTAPAWSGLDELARHSASPRRSFGRPRRRISIAAGLRSHLRGQDQPRRALRRPPPRIRRARPVQVEMASGSSCAAPSVMRTTPQSPPQ